MRKKMGDREKHETFNHESERQRERLLERKRSSKTDRLSSSLQTLTGELGCILGGLFVVLSIAMLVFFAQWQS